MKKPIDKMRIEYNKYYGVINFDLPDHGTIYMSKERFLIFAEFVKTAKNLYFGIETPTFKGKPLSGYQCPKCGGKDLKEGFKGTHILCVNCGVMPVEDVIPHKP